MRLSTKVAYNTIIQIASKIIATALGLIAIAVMARYLGREGFGQYTTIVTFLSFFGIIADLGLTLITVQMISQPNVDENKILSNLFSLRLISAVVFLGIAPLMVIFFPYEPIIKLGVAIASLSFFFIALNQILTGLFQKNLRMDKVSIAEVASKIILAAGVILVYYLDLGLLNMLVAAVAASAVNFLLHYLFSRRFARIKLCFDFAVWREIAKKSWPLAITIIFNLIYLKTDTLLLSLIKRPSEIGIIAEVGVYGAAYRVIDVLITVPFMFAGIILPILTARWAKGEKQGFNNVLQKSFDMMAMFAIPLVVGAQFTAKDIMVLVAGSDFEASGPILQVLIAAAGIIFLGCMFAHAIIALDKQKKIIGFYVFTAVTAVIGYLILIPRYSYFGAAWVTIYSELAIALASFYLVWKYSKFLPNLKSIAKILGASLVMAGLLYLISGWNLFIVLALATAVYFITLYLFKGITKEDIMNLLNK